MPAWPVPDRSHTTRINGHDVETGTALAVEGLRGRYAFVVALTTPERTWIEVYGPLGGSPARKRKNHAVALTAVMTVYPKRKPNR